MSLKPSLIDKEPTIMFTDILQQTPNWVWGVLAALIAMGFKQTVMRRRSLRSATALPVVMAILSFYGLASAFSRQPLALVAWATGVVAVVTLCQGFRVWGEVQWLEAERSVLMPGSWLPLVLMLGLFCIKFGVSVVRATYPGLALDDGIAGFAGFVYGAFSGAFLARALAVWRAVRQALPRDTAY
ncbi:DUF6622 family protein [Paraburkholderia phenazinium]